MWGLHPTACTQKIRDLSSTFKLCGRPGRHYLGGVFGVQHFAHYHQGVDEDLQAAEGLQKSGGSVTGDAVPRQPPLFQSMHLFKKHPDTAAKWGF
jgi:hypothetical protein